MEVVRFLFSAFELALESCIGLHSIQPQNITESSLTLCFTSLLVGGKPQTSFTVKRRSRPIVVKPRSAVRSVELILGLSAILLVTYRYLNYLKIGRIDEGGVTSWYMKGICFNPTPPRKKISNNGRDNIILEE